MKLHTLTTSILAAALTLFSSCSNKNDDENKPISQPTSSAGGSYQSYRNPNISLSSNLPSGISVSHSRGKTNMPYVAMTFDDGPHPQNTPRLLDMLRKRNIKATFYVVGKSVSSHPHIIQRIVAEGHEIGNHTWTHRNLKTLSNEQVRWEMNKTRDAIVAACGVKPRTMRPPYGALRQDQRSWIYKEYGYPTILWDVDPQDWRKPGPSVVANRIVSNAKNGSIILAHDLHKSTIDAMPAALDGLLKRGYKFITVSQMLALGVSPANTTTPPSPVAIY